MGKGEGDPGGDGGGGGGACMGQTGSDAAESWYLLVGLQIETHAPCSPQFEIFYLI